MDPMSLGIMVAVNSISVMWVLQVIPGRLLWGVDAAGLLAYLDSR